MATAGDQRGVGPERAFHSDIAVGQTVTLSDEESAHLVRVRRVRAGDPVVCFDGHGTACLGAVVKADPRAARVALSEPYPSREPTRAVTLATSIPEPGRADAMVAALAELGVTRWIPLQCERTPPKRVDLVARRRVRWERAAREAAKVNGRATLLVVADPVLFGGVLPAGGWLLDPDPAAPLLGTALTAETSHTLQILVGPEGGFAPTEVARATEAGLRTASLGHCVLRTATAAAAAAAVALAR